MAPLRPTNSLSLLLSLLALLSVRPSSSSLPMASRRSVPQELHYRTDLLAPILSNLGFHELAMAVPALYSPVLSSWYGPITLFAPSDDSIRSCPSFSAPRLLREHLVPGLFSSVYLSKLTFGAKLETSSPGRCLSITSTSAVSKSNNSVGSNDLDRDSSGINIFVDGIEITQPDLFNDGQIVIHGIQGCVAPLSTASCGQESFPSDFSPEIDAANDGPNPRSTAIMRLMLRDAILRLHEGGYNILALAMRVKYPELAGLNNMTVFALNDHSIFAGGHAYLTDVRFHVVPNRVLMRSDLMSLRQGTMLPTLVHGQHLVLTQTGAGLSSGSLRINYVPIKELDVVCNAKIVVHSLYLPLPHLYLADIASAAILGNPEGGVPDHGSSKTRPASAAEFETCGDPNAVDTSECPLIPVAAPTSWAVIDFDEGI
ncbi:fasciclin-like arabinogalactan protein 21 [Dendrobium catenatum]|nr:fasciclin-like arabinogalactan protein 21 [Dendrobium catenatum]